MTEVSEGHSMARHAVWPKHVVMLIQPVTVVTQHKSAVNNFKEFMTFSYRLLSLLLVT